MIPQFDKYASYIWSSYGVTAAALIVLALWFAVAAARVRRRHDALEAERQRRKQETGA